MHLEILVERQKHRYCWDIFARELKGDITGFLLKSSDETPLFLTDELKMSYHENLNNRRQQIPILERNRQLLLAAFGCHFLLACQASVKLLDPVVDCL